MWPRVLLLLLSLSLFVDPGSSKWSGEYDVINYNKYYYLSIRGKMGESISASNCTIGGAALGFKLVSVLELETSAPLRQLA